MGGRHSAGECANLRNKLSDRSSIAGNRQKKPEPEFIRVRTLLHDNLSRADVTFSKDQRFTEYSFPGTVGKAAQKSNSDNRDLL
jgi:hypothetical protein